MNPSYQSSRQPDLSRLLRPKSIAVLGGSWAQNVVEQCLKAGYSGDIWPVHPKKSEVAGLPCYPSLEQLPGAPDAAFVGINRDASITAIESLRRMNCGAAICFAAGFSEARAEDERGESLQQALLQAAGNMPIIGPNCYGVLNYIDGAMLWPDQHGGQACEKGIALLTQSSNIAISLTMQQRALPIAYVMTAGNQAQLSLGQLGAAMLEDERVTALGMYIEGFGNLRDFEQMAAVARHLGKPVVAIKAGRSTASQLAMQSHTNSLAGDDAAADAFFSRLGITRVDSLTVLLESLKLLHLKGPLSGNRVQSMSCSGGEASMMADAAESIAIDYPPLEDAQASALRQALGPLVALANPLDYHTYIWDDAAAMQQAYAAMMSGSADITCLLLDFPRGDRCDASSWYTAVDALAAASRQTGRPAAVLATMPENLGESDSDYITQRGLIPLCGIDDGLRAIAVAAQCHVGLQQTPAALALPELSGPAGEVRELPELTELTESAAKQTLKARGLAIPEAVDIPASVADSAAVNEPDQLVAAVQQLSFPVVLKVQGVLHKSDVGGVVTDIADVPQLMRELQAMQRRLKKSTSTNTEINSTSQEPGHGSQKMSEPATYSFLVEEQVTDVVAELLVSVIRDRVLGLMLTVASGGTQTELLRDTAHLLLPAQSEDIRQAVATLKVNSLLQGYRGQAAANLDAVFSAIECVADFALENKDSLLELEINPLLCSASGAVVGDAILRFG